MKRAIYSTTSARRTMCPFSRVMQAKRGPCKRLHYARARGAGRVVGNSPGKSRPPEAAAFPPRKSRARLARCGEVTDREL